VSGFLRPLAGVDVPSDRTDRRNPAQPGNYVWLTNITAVDDMRNAREPLLSLRAQEAVGIRNDSNTEHSAGVLWLPWPKSSFSKRRLIAAA
jgi:hypothetical protein